MMPEKHFREKQFTKEQMMSQLKSMGINSGDSIFVHSSLRSMGCIVGGPDAVIDALLESVGTEGHIMFPTFNFQDYSTPFDSATSPTTMGIVPETARKRKEFIRSNYPNGALAISGSHAEIIIAEHLRRGHCRPGDPIDMLAMMGGYVMLIGVTFRSNTTIHIGECYGDLPHRRQSFEGPYNEIIYADGNKVVVNTSGGPNCDGGFQVVEGLMRERSHIIDGKLGAVPVQLMKGKDVIMDTVDLIKRTPWAIYCNDPKCAHCVKFRKIVREEYKGSCL